MNILDSIHYIFFSCLFPLPHPFNFPSFFSLWIEFSKLAIDTISIYLWNEMVCVDDDCGEWKCCNFFFLLICAGSGVGGASFFLGYGGDVLIFFFMGYVILFFWFFFLIFMTMVWSLYENYVLVIHY